MEKIVVALGSTRRPKVNAVTEALASIRNLFENSPEFEVVGVEVASGVRHTPLTREDLMAGARQRAEGLARMARASGHAWKYFVGLEGGFDVIPGLDAMPSLDVVPELDVVREAQQRWVFLESWAYVADIRGAGHLGGRGRCWCRRRWRRAWWMMASSFRRRLMRLRMGTIFAMRRELGGYLRGI